MHEGHRSRVREKFKSNGIEGFATHEVLELLLFYSNRRCDTNGIAHRLLERFGSFSAVLEAPVEELVQVEGVGESAATLINLVPQLFRKYMEEKNLCQTISINSSESVAGYLLPRFLGLNSQRFALLCISSAGKVTNFTFVSDGAAGQSQVNTRKVVQTALSSNADFVVFAHNHPGGSAAPSRNDVQATKVLTGLLTSMGIEVVDHIIISNEDYYSMADAEKYKDMFCGSYDNG